MLVLSRRKNEAIVINDDITVVVVEIRGDTVRLGIQGVRPVVQLRPSPGGHVRQEATASPPVWREPRRDMVQG